MAFLKYLFLNISMMPKKNIIIKIIGIIFVILIMFNECALEDDLLKLQKDKAAKVRAVTSVNLDIETLNLDVGESKNLIAIIQPQNAINKNVSWSTSDNIVASVDHNGKVTAHSVGAVIITVTTTDGNMKAFCNLTVTPIVNAEPPIFTIHPYSKSDYLITDTAISMNVTATVTDGGTITYQWFRNTINSTEGGVSVGTGSSYTPNISVPGFMYYYVVATNTNNSASGNKTAMAISNIAIITTSLTGTVNASTPNILIQPQSKTDYFITSTAVSLTVLANVTDGGIITYQWYKNSINSTTGGSFVGTGLSYTPDITSVGTFYYYVIATNTNNSASGNKTAIAISNIAIITSSPTGTVNASTPVFTIQPLSKIDYITTSTAISLTASVVVSDGGTVTYQWFRNTTNSTIGGTSVGTGTNYTPIISTAGTFYYYVEATNTNNAVNGNKTATTKSNVATITSVTPVNAETPIFSEHPQSKIDYLISATANSLTVSANVNDGGIITYQWFRNTSNNTTSGTLVGTGASYTPLLTTADTFYYYAEATNTNNNVNGNKTAKAKSNIAIITSALLFDAATPIISSHPQSRTDYIIQNTPVAMTISASVNDSGTLTYQWYRNTTRSNTGGIPVGAGNTSYTPNISTDGTFYYYVEVTNTNNTATGNKTTTVKSNIATITSKEYKLGDTGPGGGKIFSYNNGYFYEVSPNDLTAGVPFPITSITWSVSSYIANITTSTSGSGSSNTNNILLLESNAPAAKACRDYRGGGKSNWYLPSKNELNLLYNNRSHVGNMEGLYWSSTADSVDSAWCQDFSNGEQRAYYILGQCFVRAIRFFNSTN